MNIEPMEDLLEVFDKMWDLVSNVRYQTWPPKDLKAHEFDEILFEAERVHRKAKRFINKVKKEKEQKHKVEIELSELEKRLKDFLKDKI